MPTQFDVAVIGTGTSAYHVIHHCLKKGLSLAVIDSQPFGGTCALRGCQPKKYLVAAASAVEIAKRMQGIGIASIPRMDSDLVASCSETGHQYRADMVVHGAGRVPDLEDLDLKSASVEFSGHGVTVNEYLQSVSNPSVYAIGDAANTPYQLATTADMEGMAVANNITDGNHEIPDYAVVPSVVFTLPPLASVGIQEEAAIQQGISIKAKRGTMNQWPSSKRIGQKHSGYKVIQDKQTGRILGAHIFGHNADEVINVMALAIKFKIPPEELKKMIWAYPTYTSDIKYMYD